MNKMKRIFSLVLAFAMLFGSFSALTTVAFAEEVEEKVVETEEVKEEAKEEEKAPIVEGDKTKALVEVPKDVIGTEFEKSIRRLVAFGVVGGYPDGTYKPEVVINRAQFSKMIVEALGLNDAVASVANKPTGFRDVYAGHWATGYINVANAQGLLKGYPDGTFLPENQITYAEALTILVRALGYQDSFLYGNWPTNYITKAADLDITEDVAIPTDYNAGAKRGYIAQLLDNTLNTKVVKVKEYEGVAISYEPTEIKLLEDKLKIVKQKSRILGDKIVNDNLKEDVIEVAKIVDNFDKGLANPEKLNVKEGVQYRPYMGLEADVFVYDGEDVVLVEDRGKVDYAFDFIENIDRDDEYELVELNGKYQFHKDAKIYEYDKDGKRFVKGKKDGNYEGWFGRVVVENSEIVYAELMNDKIETDQFMVVKEVKDDKLIGLTNSRSNEEIDFSSKSTYEKVSVFDQDGNHLEVKDIKKGDVAYAAKTRWDRRDHLFVTVVQDNNVTGELGRATKDYVELDKDSYDVLKLKDGETYARVSSDSLESSQAYSKAVVETELYEEDVIAYRGAGNLVVLIANNDDEAGSKYGIVTRVFDDGDRLELFTSVDGKDGEVLRYDLEDYKDFDENFKTEKSAIGEVVKFRINKDGEIAKGSLKHAKDIISSEEVVFGADSVYFKKSEKETEGYRVAQNATVIEAYNFGTDESKYTKEEAQSNGRVDRKASDDFVVYDFEDIEYTEFKGETNPKELTFVPVIRANGEVEALVLLGKGVDKLREVRNIQEAIFITELGRRGDDFDAKYNSYVSGPKVEKGEDAEVDGDPEEHTAYVAEINRRGKVTVLDDGEDFDYHEVYRGVTVTEDVRDTKEENTIKIKDAKELDKIEVSESALLYKVEDGEAEETVLRDIKKGDKIEIIATKGNIAEIVVVYKDGKSREDAKGLLEGVSKTRVIIDGDLYKMDEDTILYDKDGKVVAVGGEDIAEFIENEKYYLAKSNIKDGLVKDMTLGLTVDKSVEQEVDGFYDYWNAKVHPIQDKLNPNKDDSFKSLAELDDAEKVMKEVENKFNRLSKEAQDEAHGGTTRDILNDVFKKINSTRETLESEEQKLKNLLNIAKEKVEEEAIKIDENITVYTVQDKIEKLDVVVDGNSKTIKEHGIKVIVEKLKDITDDVPFKIILEKDGIRTEPFEITVTAK